jgi:hypothetical protein
MLGSKIRRREKRISALLRGVFCFPSVDWECMLRPLSLFETGQNLGLRLRGIAQRQGRHHRATLAPPFSDLDCLPEHLR